MRLKKERRRLEKNGNCRRVGRGGGGGGLFRDITMARNMSRSGVEREGGKRGRLLLRFEKVLACHNRTAPLCTGPRPRVKKETQLGSKGLLPRTQTCTKEERTSGITLAGGGTFGGRKSRGLSSALHHHTELTGST